MASSASSDRLTLSYLLWLGGFFGFSGLHRIYNGKIVTGLIWFFTLGVIWCWAVYRRVFSSWDG